MRITSVNVRTGNRYGGIKMDNLIEVKGLKKYFSVPSGQLHAVDNVSFSIARGTTMGVVGESGCGKSTLGRVLIHLYEPTEGQILFENRDITNVKKGDLKMLHREMAMIFQDPYSSLNPRYTVEQTLDEALKLAHHTNFAERAEEKLKIMEMVGLDKRYLNSYPHELDGGRRQRVGIGRALCLNPKFIVCDEPVSALDVSIQAQILNLLMDLQEKYKLTYLFITHNMAVVRHISDHICVMYLGQLVEVCETKRLFHHAMHPYTRALLSAIPTTNIFKQKEQQLMKGELTSPINPKPGCRFSDRCPYACSQCQQPQVLRELEPNHFVQCCRAEDLLDS